MILYFRSKFRINRSILHRDIAKKWFSILASVRHLEFAKFWIFVKWPSRELDFASAYQIWSKLDNSRLRYGGNAIFKMAAVRHLEFAKIAVLVSWRCVVIHVKCDPNRLRGYGAVGSRKWPFPITLASGLYNSLYYRTSRDQLNIETAYLVQHVLAIVWQITPKVGVVRLRSDFTI